MLLLVPQIVCAQSQFDVDRIDVPSVAHPGSVKIAGSGFAPPPEDALAGDVGRSASASRSRSRCKRQ